VFIFSKNGYLLKRNICSVWRR